MFFAFYAFIGSDGAARPQGAHTKSARRAAGARKKRCAFPLLRSKELFQPAAQSALPLLGPGLRPGRCGWVGSPEGVGRGSRNPLPPPLGLAQRKKTKKKRSVQGGAAVLLRLANFPSGPQCALVKIGARRQTQLPVSSTGRASVCLPQAAPRLPPPLGLAQRSKRRSNRVLKIRAAKHNQTRFIFCLPNFHILRTFRTCTGACTVVKYN